MNTDPVSSRILEQARFSGIHLGSPFAMSLALRRGVLYLVVEGSMTQHIPDEFSDAVDAALAALPSTPLAVDLSRANQVSSVVIAYLVSFVKSAQGRGQKQVPMLGANQRIQTLIRMVGLVDLFAQAGDEDQVQALMRKP